MDRKTTIEALVEQLREDARCYRGHYPLLARISGVSYGWMCKFLSDPPEITTPGFTSLVRLESGLQKLKEIDPQCGKRDAA